MLFMRSTYSGHNKTVTSNIRFLTLDIIMSRGNILLSWHSLSIYHISYIALFVARKGCNEIALWDVVIIDSYQITKVKNKVPAYFWTLFSYLVFCVSALFRPVILLIHSTAYKLRYKYKFANVNLPFCLPLINYLFAIMFPWSFFSIWGSRRRYTRSWVQASKLASAIWVNAKLQYTPRNM